MKLDDLLNITNVAKFLGTPEDNVAELLDDGRLGGILVAALRNKGVPVTPKLKNSVENVVTSLRPPPDLNDSGLRGGQKLGAEQVITAEATATIMFTDIVASTALTDKLGDRLSREVFKIHNDIIRRHTKEHGGAEVKSMETASCSPSIVPAELWVLPLALRRNCNTIIEETRTHISLSEWAFPWVNPSGKKRTSLASP